MQYTSEESRQVFILTHGPAVTAVTHARAPARADRERAHSEQGPPVRGETQTESRDASSASRTASRVPRATRERPSRVPRSPPRERARAREAPLAARARE